MTKALILTVKPAPRRPDLAVSVSRLAAFVAGATGSYRLQVTNTGTAATTGVVTLAEHLPAGLTYASASGSGWSCHSQAATARCTRTTPIAAAANSTVVVRVRITAHANTVLTTTTTVAPTDATSADNTAIDRVTIRHR